MEEITLTCQFAGKPVKVFRPQGCRHLESLCGTVSTEAPVVLRYRRAKRRAEKEAARLERYGYDVTVERS